MNDPDVLRAFALSRATGAPALSCLAGVRAEPVPGAAVRLGLPGGPTGLLDVAMLADLALGAAVRSRVGADRQLPTVTLTVQLTAPLPAASTVRVRAEGSAVGSYRQASAAGAVLDGETPVGHCGATFALGRRLQVVMPWEQRDRVEPDPLTEDRLTDVEAAALATIRARNSTSAGEALLAAGCEPGGRDPSHLRLTPSTLLANRSGTVQGGVLFALADRSAALASAGDLATGHAQFVSGADVAVPLDASSVVLRSGRRTSFVRTDVHQAGRLVATASFVRRAPVTPAPAAAP